VFVQAKLHDAELRVLGLKPQMSLEILFRVFVLGFNSHKKKRERRPISSSPLPSHSREVCVTWKGSQIGDPISPELGRSTHNQ
jgi:hypothetical protein